MIPTTRFETEHRSVAERLGYAGCLLFVVDNGAFAYGADAAPLHKLCEQLGIFHAYEIRGNGQEAFMVAPGFLMMLTDSMAETGIGVVQLVYSMKVQAPVWRFQATREIVL